MVHIELVTGKSIKVQQTPYQLTNASGSVFRLTMVTSERVWDDDYESVEQEIFLHKDKIVYFYEV